MNNFTNKITKMKSVLIILILAAGLLATDNEWVYNCTLNLVTPFDQSNTIVTNMKLHNCSEANIFWNYPMNNLTIVFTVPQSKPFQFCLINSDSIYDDIPVYRVTSSQETKVGKSSEKVCMQSDSTNSLTLKLVGPPKMKYYGVFVDFSITV